MKALVRFGMFAALVSQGWAQAFRNLNFDLGTLPPNYQAVSATLAQQQQLLPGWELFSTPVFPDYQFPYLFFNDLCIGSPCISLHPKDGYGGFGALQGKWSLLLQTAMQAEGETGIRQQGQAPVGSRSVSFKASTTAGVIRFQINGRPVPLFPVATNANSMTYAANLPPTAGNAPLLLSIAAFNNRQSPSAGLVLIDDLRFATSTLPPANDAPPSIMVIPGKYYPFALQFSGVLQFSEQPGGPFEDLVEAISPCPLARLSPESQQFFRARSFTAFD